MQDKHVDFDLIFNQDGTVECPWWTKEADKTLKKLGTPDKGYETVNSNPWCG